MRTVDCKESVCVDLLPFLRVSLHCEVSVLIHYLAKGFVVNESPSFLPACIDSRAERATGESIANREALIGTPIRAIVHFTALALCESDMLLTIFTGKKTRQCQTYTNKSRHATSD